ncbi:glucan 1,3-beta-glucosidase precursor [Lodderomyces elongisporus NRRL YB-4239]|uniref:Glucan 1,3-beta-glucosidase n=1 Tax=Lodderomyces elongisporus (strain ATCC 11503 / CBS 2605 / JCM 1781 / NBRC 1676 / NRRL YB-4239) TaxID=379508 RepID=A5DVW5_LODEL|nr:glucan 1,3-beta-glucosidase precursor [Lodderomyces elongisporus NRRL YB-4239]
MKVQFFAILAIFIALLDALIIKRQEEGNSASLDSANSNLKSKRQAWDYQNDITRGLNLGGWFVLEPYITPSLFGTWLFPENTPVDEYHFTKQLGKDAALQVLNQHWSTWITEDDFQQISYLGINMVRIPIGYWAFQLLDNDPYVQGQVEYLDKALEWARTHGLKVWVDLHGAPGSQNGFDNSGLRDHYEWQNGNNVQVTLDVLNTIFQKYGGDEYADVVSGIELINEPLGPALDMDAIKQFYQDGYSALRNTGSSTPVIIHDAFQSLGYWNNFLQTSNSVWNVVIDHHHYQVFSAGELQRSIDEHVSTACNWGWDTKKESHWTVAGEWSAALTDCAPWLNGVGRGARFTGDYDNSPYIGSCDSLDTGNMRRYIEAQLDAFEYNGGWIFWNWKTEDALEWDFQKLTFQGIFPQPLTDRQYPNQCNFNS